MRKWDNRDKNEKAIMDGLRSNGWFVQPISHPVQKGVPDLLISKTEKRRKVTLVVEVKQGNRKLNRDQVRWKSRWQGEYVVGRTVQQTLNDCEAIFRGTYGKKTQKTIPDLWG